MTQTSSYIDKKARRAPVMPLLRFFLRQFWTTFLLFGIILFFIIPVPVLMWCTENSHGSHSAALMAEQLAEDWLPIIRMFLVPIISIFGVVVSCARFSYLKNKVSIDFYHSLPITRLRLYMLQLTVGAAALLIPYLVNILLTLLITGMGGYVSGPLIVGILGMTGEIIVYASFFYSLSTLIGMISGLTAVHLTLSAVGIFIVPAIYLVSVAFADIFSENMWVDWYISGEVFERLSPVFRFLINSDPLSVTEVLLMLLLSGGMLTGGYFIYVFRKSERAGIPVVFTPLGEIIKYLLMYIGTLLGGLLFYYIMDSFFWTVFGMLCGMLLVFMLTNTILQKTARAMFKGIKGLFVFASVSALMFILISCNAFSINSRVPSPMNTSRVTVSFGDMADGIVLRDRENIEAVTKLYSESFWCDDIHPSDSWCIFEHDSMTLSVVYHPKIGLPVAKSVRIYNKSGMKEEFRRILDSEEFKTQYASILTDRLSDNGSTSVSGMQFTFDTDNGRIYYNSKAYTTMLWKYDIVKDEFLFDKLKEDLAECGFDFFQKQSYGYILNNSHSFNRSSAYPIFEGMDNIIEAYREIGLIDFDPDTLCADMAELIDSVTVYPLKSKESDSGLAPVVYLKSSSAPAVITDKKQIREILEGLATPLCNPECGEFTFIDTGYYVEYTLKITEYYQDNETIYYYKEGEPIVEEMENNDTSTHTGSLSIESVFLEGRVPQFIKDMFE